MTDITKQQLEVALKEHQNIQARHDQLVRDLEAAQSELNISHRYLEDLKNQLNVLKTEDHDLAGLLHPIRQCPRDILLCIFEWSIEIDTRKRLKVANSLSQVCRFWRDITLGMSCLWCDIEISLKDSVGPLEWYMRRTKDRIGDSSVNITLRNIGECDIENMKKIMDHVQLGQFKSIKTLRYCLTTSKDLTQLANSSLFFAPSLVEQVEVEVVSSSEQAPDWSCKDILKQSTTTKSLQLKVYTTTLFEGDDIYPSLLKLHILSSPVLSLSSHLHMFPSLQDLKISGKSFDMQPLSQSIILPELQVLCIF